MKFKRAHLFKTYLAQGLTHSRYSVNGIVIVVVVPGRRNSVFTSSLGNSQPSRQAELASEDTQRVRVLLLKMWPVHQQEHYWEFVRKAQSQALPQIC